MTSDSYNFTLNILVKIAKEPMTEHTLIESVIERKNHYQGRMADNMANIIYFTKHKALIEKNRDKMKVDTEERAEKNKEIMQAEKGIDRGHENVIADKMLVESFAELLASLKKKTTKAKALKA